MKSVQLLRRPAVQDALNKSRTAIYEDIKAGRLTKPVKLSSRHACWPSNEIEAIIHAHIRGESDDAIKVLVGELHAQRITSGVAA